MAGLFGKIKDKVLGSPWSPLGPVVSPVGMIHKENQKKKKFTKKEKQKQKQYARQFEKGVKQWEKEQKKYNEGYYSGPYGEKKFNEKLEKFQKKYGGEKFQRFDALSGKQKSVLDQVLKQGKSGLKNLRTPEDFGDISKEKLNKAATGTLQDLLKGKAVSDPRKEGIFKLGKQGLEGLLNQPSIQDLQQYAPFQGAEQYTQDLLSQDPEAYNRFAEPTIRQFQEEIVPQLRNQYGGHGNQFNRALGKGITNLGSNLGALRASLQGQGANQAVQLGQAIQNGQNTQANIYGNAATSALNYANAPYASQIANAEIQGKAAQTGIPYLDLKLKQQGLQNQNIMNQNEQATGLAKLGLGVNPYHAAYRPPTPPTGGIVTGGRQPVQKFAGLPPQPQSYQPGFAGQLAGAFIPAAATAAGAAFGGPAGAAAGSTFGEFFNGGGNPSGYVPQQKLQGFNTMNT